MASAISRFRIPVGDIARAKRFYETVCALQLEHLHTSPGMEMWGSVCLRSRG